MWNVYKNFERSAFKETQEFAVDNKCEKSVLHKLFVTLKALSFGNCIVWKYMFV